MESVPHHRVRSLTLPTLGFDLERRWRKDNLSIRLRCRSGLAKIYSREHLPNVKNRLAFFYLQQTKKRVIFFSSVVVCVVVMNQVGKIPSRYSLGTGT